VIEDIFTVASATWCLNIGERVRIGWDKDLDVHLIKDTFYKLDASSKL